MTSLGQMEAAILSISAMLARKATNSADVGILGFEAIRNENVLNRLAALLPK